MTKTRIFFFSVGDASVAVVNYLNQQSKFINHFFPFFSSILAASTPARDKNLILSTNLRNLMLTNSINRPIMHPTRSITGMESDKIELPQLHQTAQMAHILQKAQEITNKMLHTNESKNVAGPIGLITPKSIEKLHLQTNEITKQMQPIAALSTSIVTRALGINLVVPPSTVPINSSNNTGRSQTTSPFHFKCPLCLLNYRSQTFLNEHMRKEHSVLI